MIRFAGTARAFLGEQSLAGWMPIGEPLGELLWKAAGHKYIRKVPAGVDPKTGRTRYRYYYRVTGGHGLGHEDEIVVGAAFRLPDKYGTIGHYHVMKVAGDMVTLQHDESALGLKVSKQDLAKMLREHHQNEVRASLRRLQAQLAEARRHGTAKQRRRIMDQIYRYGHVHGGLPSPSRHPLDKSPTKVGPVSIEMTRSEVETAIRHEPLEHAVAFDEDGTQVLRRQGTDSSVPLSDVALGFKEHGGITLTHNHPSGFPLSPQDIHFAMVANLASMRATTPDGGVWVVDRPAEGWWKKGDPLWNLQREQRLEMAYLTAVARARERMDAIVEAAGGTPGDPKALGFSDEKWRALVTEEANAEYNKLLADIGTAVRREGVPFVPVTEDPDPGQPQRVADLRPAAPGGEGEAREAEARAGHGAGDGPSGAIVHGVKLSPLPEAKRSDASSGAKPGWFTPGGKEGAKHHIVSLEHHIAHMLDTVQGVGFDQMADRPGDPVHKIAWESAVDAPALGEQHLADAREIIAWAKKHKGTTPWAQAIRTIAADGAINRSRAKLAQSMVEAFLDERAKDRQGIAPKASQEHFGEVGDKIGGKTKGAHPPLEVTVLGRANFQNQWGGSTDIVTMRDDAGRTFVWKTGSSTYTNADDIGNAHHSGALVDPTPPKTKWDAYDPPRELKRGHFYFPAEGDRVVIDRAKIADHDQYNGTAQTRITHAKLRRVIPGPAEVARAEARLWGGMKASAEAEHKAALADLDFDGVLPSEGKGWSPKDRRLSRQHRVDVARRKVEEADKKMAELLALADEHDRKTPMTKSKRWVLRIRKALQFDMFGRHVDLSKNPRGRKDYSTTGQIHLPSHRPPGAGWQPIPNSKHGGFRRRRGTKWEYWYPDGNHGTHAAPREPEPEPKAPKVQPKPTEPPKQEPAPTVAPTSAALEKLKAKYGLDEEQAQAVAKTADNLVRLGMHTDREQAIAAAGEAHAKKKGWKAVTDAKPKSEAKPKPKPKAAPSPPPESKPEPEQKPKPERKREATPSRSKREEVLAERGQGGLSVTSQTEKDARDWGEKIGGARKDIYDDLSSRQLEELEAQGGTVAFRAVTKDAVLGKHDPDYDSSLGLTPGASMIKRSIWRYIAPRPENTPGHRENYVAAAEWLRKMVDTKKTAREMRDFLRDWQHTVRLERVTGPVIPADEFIKLVGAVKDTPEARQASRTYTMSRTVYASDGTAYIYSAEAAKQHGFVWMDQSTHAREFTEAEKAQRKQHLEVWSKAPFTDETGREAYRKFRDMDESRQHGAPVQTYIRTPDVERLTRYSQALGQKFEVQLRDQKKSRGAAALWSDASDAVRHDEAGGGWGPLQPKAGGGKGSSLPKSSHAFKPEIERATRVGPPVQGRPSEQALTRDFGMRAGEFGRSVSDDIGDAHVVKSYEALSDLAEILGLERKQLSHGGQLAVAFGARGRGGARAHYEPGKKVINITKNAAGSLAHEWGHFLDHIASSEGLVTDGGKRLRATFSSHGEHADKLPDEVRAAFAGVMAAINHGGNAEGAERIRIARERFEELRRKGSYGAGHVAKLNAAVREVRDAIRAAPGLKRSEFAEHAAIMGGYWERPHEMFARAFEAFVEDELASKGRKSEYLVAGTAKRLELQRKKKVGKKETVHTVEIYPHGEDRKAINGAMRRLFGAMSTTGYLQKALGLHTATAATAVSA